MPKMGESLQEGTITKWIKKVGDVIERDEMILEISTDKVDTEVPAPNSGVLTEILVQEGTTVEVGSIIAYIETDASQATSAPAAAATSAPEPVVVMEEAPKVSAPAPAVQAAPAPTISGNLVEVVMPKMGESLQEGTVTKWLKKVGQEIERDEMILEISTDKVDTEVPAPVGGILAEIMVKEGETVEVGTPIAKISTGGSATTQATAQVQEAPKQTAAEPQAEAPKTTSTTVITSGTKEIPSRYENKFFSPLVRTIAEENGIFLEELLTISGTGVDGRINKEDILNYIKNRGIAPIVQAAPAVQEAPKVVAPAPVKETPKPSAPAPTASKPQINIPAGADYEVIPMDRIRQLISEHMTYSKHTSAHVTSVSEVDVTNLVNYRNKHKDAFEKKEGYKLTFTPFFAQAVIDAIRQFPMVNVSVDGKNILKHRRINLGVATALPDGNLIVPVIKGSDMLNTKGIAYSIYDLSTRARSKKLNPDDIQGGTVTLTNVGTFGTLFGTPVINQPQVAIFGVGAIKKRPVVKEIDGNDIILVRHMMYVSITYDHRVIDGMLAGQTLAAVVKNLESMNENTINL